MAVFYHVDRAYATAELHPLAAGKSITLESTTPALSMLYPGGLSNHGPKYLIAWNANSEKEIICELVRMGLFADKPSRFQSIFGWETLSAAVHFLMDYTQPKHPNYGGEKVAIWSVTCTASPHKGDMRWFDGWQRESAFEAMAAYWRGEAKSDDPMWEIVLPLPVHVDAIEAVYYRSVDWRVIS